MVWSIAELWPELLPQLDVPHQRRQPRRLGEPWSEAWIQMMRRIEGIAGWSCSDSFVAGPTGVQLLEGLKSAGFRECAIAQVQGKKGEQGSGGVVFWWILCIVMLCYAYNRLAVKLLKQQEQLIILSCVTLCHLLATLLVNEQKMVDSGEHKIGSGFTTFWTTQLPAITIQINHPRHQPSLGVILYHPT